MSWLYHPIAGWVVGALFLFWVVGAYNRLLRLRTVVLQSYTALDGLLVRQLNFVQSSFTADAPNAWPADPAGLPALQAAVIQVSTVLGATRSRPLDPKALATLGTALHVLQTAWQRVHPEAVVSFESDGTLTRPASLEAAADEPHEASATGAPMLWPEPLALVEITRGQFNTAVAQYNQAVRQFPALLLAWVLRLRPAAPLL